MPVTFHPTPIGTLIHTDLKSAKSQLADLLERYHGDTVRAAASLKVTRRTFDRWLVRCGLLERARGIRAKVRERKAK